MPHQEPRSGTFAHSEQLSAHSSTDFPFRHKVLYMHEELQLNKHKTKIGHEGVFPCEE